MTTDVSKINDYQIESYKFAQYPGMGKMLGFLYTLLGLVNEVGEAVEHIRPLYEDIATNEPGTPLDEILNILATAELTGQEAGKLKKDIRDRGVLPISEAKPLTLPDGVKEKLIKEFGDVFWYMVGVLSELGIDAAHVCQVNYNKLSDRANRGVIKGDGDNR